MLSSTVIYWSFAYNALQHHNTRGLYLLLRAIAVAASCRIWPRIGKWYFYKAHQPQSSFSFSLCIAVRDEMKMAREKRGNIKDIATFIIRIAKVY